jgi:hypothetical protein
MSYDIYVHYKDGQTNNYPLCGSSTAERWEDLAEHLSLTFFRVIQGVESIYTRERMFLFIYEMQHLIAYLDEHPEMDYNDMIKSRIVSLLPAMSTIFEKWDEVEYVTY